MTQPNESPKLFTYRVTCSFELQYSFNESEVERDWDGGEKDFRPTELAISALEKELLEKLQNNYVVESVEARTEFDHLLGISIEDEEDVLPQNDGEQNTDTDGNKKI